MNEPVAEKPEILVVDDSKVIRMAANKMLSNDYQIHLAEDGQIAWEILQKNHAISVVFTDLSMPHLDGMGLLKCIRSADDEHIMALPVIILTGHEDSESMKQTVFDAGATDFITKPFQSIDLISRAKAYARLSRKVVELEKETSHDKLTGLYNAESLQEQGAKAYSFAARHKLSMSTVYFEIKDFQECFLTNGKNVAQHIISVVGKRLQQLMREEDIAARIGVARYALVLPMASKKTALVVVSRVCEVINKLVFDTGKKRIRITIVAGYTVPDLIEKNAFSGMLKQAENALQRAIESTTGPVVCFQDVVKPEIAVEMEGPPVVISEQDIERAFSYILAGDFYQVPEQHLAAIVGRLTPFLQYVDNQKELDSMAESDDDSLEKKLGNL